MAPHFAKLWAIDITLTLAIPDAIFTEGLLSFGQSRCQCTDNRDWGIDRISSMRSYPFQLIFPALAISGTLSLALYSWGWLRNVLDQGRG